MNIIMSKHLILTLLTCLCLSSVAQNIDETRKTAPPQTDTINIEVTQEPDLLLIDSTSMQEQDIIGVSLKNGDISDTIRFTIGQTEIIFLDNRKSGNKNNADTIEYSSKNNVVSKKRKVFEGHLSSINLGMNMLTTKGMNLSLPPESNYFDLDDGRSVEFNIMPLELDIPIVSKTLGLVAGMGITWNNYYFDNSNTILHNTQPVLTYSIDSARNWKKSKLGVVTLDLPLMLEFQFLTGHNKTWIAAGAYGSIKIASKNKLKGSNGGKVVNRKDFHIHPLQCGLLFRAGYGNFGIYADYGIISMFKRNEGPELYPLSMGITLTFD